MKEQEENKKKLEKMKTKSNNILLRILFFCCSVVGLTTSCDYFKSQNENEIHIPEDLTEEQLQEQRYTYKRDRSYKEKFLHQTKTDSVIITIFNITNYQIKDNDVNIGEGYNYYIFDIAVDNFTNSKFNIGNFTKSCNLGNAEPGFAYSNVSYALKMYYLQSDSLEFDIDYMKRFYLNEMPEKEFYRTKLFAFEVSKSSKDPLFFRYKIANQKFEYQMREALN